MSNSSQPLTVERCDAAILYLAECVLTRDEKHAGVLYRMIEVVTAERDRLANLPDPRARARAIIEAHQQKGSTIDT